MKAYLVALPLTRGAHALVDAADLQLVEGFSWRLHQQCGMSYAMRSLRLPTGTWTNQYLHRLLTSWPMVDHANGDGLDNRRANLRQASAWQNNANTRKRAGTSRFKGVHWHSQSRRWRAEIKRQGRRLSLGLHLDEFGAALAYDAAARDLFGRFASLNFPSEGERSALIAREDVES